MYARVEKPKENKSRAVANSVSQNKSFDYGKKGVDFIDNRQEAILQRKLLGIMKDEVMPRVGTRSAEKQVTKQLVARTQTVDLTTITNSDSRHMGVVGAAGQEPDNQTVGIVDAVGTEGWGGVASAPSTKYWRAHALAQVLGGTGDNTNVAWWTENVEKQWTIFDEQVQGRKEAGFDQKYKPSKNEKGTYEISSNSSQLDIKPNYQGEITNAVNKLNIAELSFQGSASESGVALQNIDWDAVRDDVRGILLATAAGRIGTWLNDLFTNTVGGIWMWDDIAGKYTRTLSKGGDRGQRRNKNMMKEQLAETRDAGDFEIAENQELEIWGLMKDAQTGVFSKGNNPFKLLSTTKLVKNRDGDEVARFKFSIGNYHEINTNFNV